MKKRWMYIWMLRKQTKNKYAANQIKSSFFVVPKGRPKLDLFLDKMRQDIYN